MDSVINQYVDENMALYNGDSAEVLKGIPDNSVHFMIYSPPFASLYVYSNSERDLGNCKTLSEFYTQFEYIVKELYRCLMPGRLMAVHCMNLPTTKGRDGFIGIQDFRGDLISLFQKAGFYYHSEVCIWKDPVVQMQRTKALGLLHKQIKKDSAMSRQGLAEYLVIMRKPGENPGLFHTPMNHSLYRNGRNTHHLYGWISIRQILCSINLAEMKKMKSIYAHCSYL